MRSLLRVLAMAAAVSSSACSLSDSEAHGSEVLRSADQPFPAPFVDSTGWITLSDLRLPGNPDRVPSLGILVDRVAAYFEAGIRWPRPDRGVSVGVPTGAERAREVHLFITVLGGPTEVSVGTQVRLVVFHDRRGWWLDPTAEVRRYCNRPLSGIARTLCVP